MNNSTLISKATNYVRSLGRKRTNRSVTADDVQNFLNRSGFTSNVNSRLSVIRSVFASESFEPTGVTPSTRPAARGRKITQYSVR